MTPKILKSRRVAIRPRKFAFRGLYGGLSEGSAGVSPRVLRGSLGLCGGLRDIPRVFGGNDPLLVTLQNCWILSGTGNSRTNSRESFAIETLFFKRLRPIRPNHSNFRFARITQFARIDSHDSRESRH